MTYAIAGNVDAGGTNLAQRLSKLFPDHTFTRLVYEAGEEKDEALSACDGVLIAVNLLEGPMPGTRAAVSDCRRAGKDIIGFVLTHEDDFDHQKKVPAHFKEQVEIDAVKRSEDGQYLVVRLHDFAGARQHVTVKTAFAYQAWAEGSLMEKPVSEFTDGEVTLELHPYEIKTILFRL